MDFQQIKLAIALRHIRLQQLCRKRWPMVTARQFIRLARAVTFAPVAIIIVHYGDLIATNPFEPIVLFTIATCALLVAASLFYDQLIDELGKSINSLPA